MKKLQAALLTAGLMAAGSAQASLISFDFFNDHETTEIQQTGELGKFDETLGSLASVTVNLLGESISSTILENKAANGQNFSYTSELNFFFEILGLSQVLNLPQPTFVTTLASTNGFVNLASGNVLDLGTSSENGVYSFTFTEQADIAAFIGNGNFTVNCHTLSGSNFTGGGGNIDTNQNTTGACGAEVIYAYNTQTTVVSEPMTLWLFGGALFGFAAMRRFR